MCWGPPPVVGIPVTREAPDGMTNGVLLAALLGGLAFSGGFVLRRRAATRVTQISQTKEGLRAAAAAYPS